MRQIEVVDKDVVLGWFQQERTYGWMIEEYRREYGVDTTPSFWGTFGGFTDCHCQLLFPTS